MKNQVRSLLIAAAMTSSTAGQAQTLPSGIAQQLPMGYTLMTFKSADFNMDGRPDYVVVVQNSAEKEMSKQGKPAPRRPLLVFTQSDNGKFILTSRNDLVAYALNEGEQCDPFSDSEAGLVVKGAFFTVQNAVACGAHWTDYLTFKYSPEHRNFNFHKRIFESWVMNNSHDPAADALVLGKRVVSTASKLKPISLQNYRPSP